MGERGWLWRRSYNQSLAHKARGGYCFSVRPKARTGKIDREKGMKRFNKRNPPFLCPAFLRACLYTSLPPYRAPVGVETGRAIWFKKKQHKKKKHRDSEGAPLMFLGGIHGHYWYIWKGNFCRHVADDRQSYSSIPAMPGRTRQPTGHQSMITYYAVYTYVHTEVHTYIQILEKNKKEKSLSPCPNNRTHTQKKRRRKKTSTEPLPIFD